MNYVELIQRRARLVFGNKAKAERWLSQPLAGADASSRLQMAESRVGYELVKSELKKLCHGYAC